MKANVKYQNGWISEFRSGKMPIQKVINGDTFKIRFNLSKTEIEKCAEYINSNL